jgi:hypothetical protein
LQNLLRWDKDCYDGILWLRKNQDQFRMQVFEPPIISLTVPDKNYIHAVEACFNSNQLKVWFNYEFGQLGDVGLTAIRLS